MSAHWCWSKIDKWLIGPILELLPGRTDWWSLLDCDWRSAESTQLETKAITWNPRLRLWPSSCPTAVLDVSRESSLNVVKSTSALNTTQQNYAQIEKEASAIRFGYEKFHQLIYGSQDRSPPLEPT
ncbi:K02A2.6-like [Cordylochernes scorpioides]|uniref:K02A2.6-like n=1 Tax=Cordylochernes scorpioides TaxID=51811 RepID=A0ABY6KRG2_9ARAC|nr:K02A2.6-like [Cordylochernes scorpioides]